MPKFNYGNQTQTDQRTMVKLNQVKNNAGGYVFKLAPMKQLERFLILGSDSPTYYQDARQLTAENSLVVKECWARYPDQTLDLILDLTKNNRIIKMDPILFAMALGTLDQDVLTRQKVYAHIVRVSRHASGLFMFLDFCQKLGKGWGRGLKNAVSQFYSQNKEGCDRLGYQMIKYRQRNGFDHSRGLRLSHPSPNSDTNANLMNWVLKKDFCEKDLPEIVQMYLEVLKDESAFYPELPWEAYPTDRIPWSLLAPAMPYTALIRNLNKFNLQPLSELEDIIVKRIETDKPNMHPFNILLAWKTYSSGQGMRSKATWNVNQRISRALEVAFYNSFQYVEPSKERYYIGMDISGSMMMPMGRIKDSNILAGEAAMAMALSILKTEPRCYVKGFTQTMVDIPLEKDFTLRQAIGARPNWHSGATDCALPMIDALQKNIQVDKFIIFTDNETWVGKIHPFQALEDYRNKMRINAKLIVCAMTSTGFSIANPSDEGMLDIVGCDSALPQLISSL